MKIVGCMACRSDGWILPLSLRVALTWCDELILWNHRPGGFEDGTGTVIRSLPMEMQERVIHAVCDDLDWNEMQHRMTMVEIARTRNATHIATVDSDEVASISLADRMRDHAGKLAPNQIACFPMVNLRNGWQYHANGLWGNRTTSVVWRDNGTAFFGGDTYHKREPIGTSMVSFPHEDPICHLWGFSERRLTVRHALYKMSDPDFRHGRKPVSAIDAMYNQAIYGNQQSPAASWKFERVPLDWISKEQRALVGNDRGVWQQEEVKRLIRVNGRERYAGLDLFGVDK